MSLPHLTAKDLDDWRAFLDTAPPRMREIVIGLMGVNAELKERNRRQSVFLKAERRELAELEHLVDVLSAAPTRRI